MRTRTWTLITLFTLAIATTAVAGIRPPVIPLAMVEPDVAIPGETLTFGAYVVDPWSDDIEALRVSLFLRIDDGSDFPWLFIRDMVLDDILGIYRCRIDIPDITPLGRYHFAVIAANNSGIFSDPYPLDVLVVPPEAPIPALLSPENGEVFGLLAPTLGWSHVDGALNYEVELTFEYDRLQFTIPGFFTQLPFNNQVWHILPDGRYLWRVRAIRNGMEGPWSEVGYFFKETIDPESEEAPLG